MYIFGKLKKIDGTLVDGVTTVISAMRENENGIIFTASSYLDNWDDIDPGCTIPFRSWDYFCPSSGDKSIETSYAYLLTLDEFSESSIVA
ncbi:TPA: hypothetical protein U6I94_001230 [Klebsiella pneumoniae]|nr:hypothetical protein [Klebsiella pneumoniae]